MSRIGFHSELSGHVSAVPPAPQSHPTCSPVLLAHIVQDADRLDAIGAIGIARCFTYGGAKGRALYDPAHPCVSDVSADQYRHTASPSINHFYEKLLKLKDIMKTNSGKVIAQQRHEFMLQFVNRFHAECDGKA